jgi:hypothetical protein
MLVEDMAAVTADIAVAAVTVVNMPRSPMLKADTLAFVLAADVVNTSRGTHAVVQGAPITRLAAVTGEVVVSGEVVDTGEVVIGIRTMDIPGLAITVWATAIHITGITVTHITDIIIPGDTILTATDTGPTGA